jgi:two-component system chemotaxis response regulator CheB
VSTAPQVRVLLVDDSATARALLRELCADEPRITVVGEAVNGREAVEKVASLRPSIVVMDISMPLMDGIEATRRIMCQTPTPILVVTSHYDRDVALSLGAVQAGALSVAAKPVGPGSASFRRDAQRLLRLVTALAEVMPVRRYPSVPRPADVPAASSGNGRMETSEPVSAVAVAASTGGPAAVYRLLELLPPQLGVPVLVVQHMTDGFTPGLTTWLAGATPLRVKLAEHGEALGGGTVYVAPDRSHLRVSPKDRVDLSCHAPVAGFRPSASVLFSSLAESYGARTGGVVLTGMGSDGLEGARALRNAGAWVLAQDAQSSAVFGMPRAVAEAGLATSVGTVEQIAYRLSRIVPSKP